MAFAAQRRADGGHQVVARHDFEDVAQGAGRQAALHHVRIAVHRHEDDRRPRVLLKNHRRGRDPVQTRHRDVADDHVRRQPLGGADQRAAVTHVGDDVEFLLQQGGDSSAVAR